MAYLLGSKACMDSLQRDVQDLQWTINAIFSRTGPVQSFSWKFPDKQAADIDIEDLLDLYDYSEEDDAEEQQVAHIALYELVIDRLLLLVHSVSKYVDSQICFDNVNKLSENVLEKSSIGLTVKEFWSQIVNLQTWTSQTVSEKNSAMSRVTKLEKDLQTSSDGGSSAQTIPMHTPGTLGIIPPNAADEVLLGSSPLKSGSSSEMCISRDSNNKACQTYETAFVPCESCDVVQRRMKEAGDIVVKICADQGLPSGLKKFKGQLTHVEWLSFNDVCRWMVEQNKDISRIGKQNDLLQQTIKPLKDEVKTCKRKTNEAEDKARSCEKSMIEEKETQTILRKQIQTKMKEQEDKHSQILCKEERDKEALRRAKEKLESEIVEIRNNLDEQGKNLKHLEADYKSIQQDLEIKQKEAERSASLSTEVAELKVQLSEVTTRLEENSKMLTREQGKNRSANKHAELLQSKQANLLSRMEVLTNENEELSQQVASLEDDKLTFEDKMAELKVEAKELRKKVSENETVIKNLSKDKEVLEEAIKDANNSFRHLETRLKEAEERERMMVEYPDLNGPVNTDLQGSGDIGVDMSNQVKANFMRIKLLEDQNNGLEDSIRKINSMRSPTVATQRSAHQETSSRNPVPLWQQNTSASTTPQSRPNVESEYEEHRVPEASYSKHFSVSKPSRTPSAQTHSTRPASASKRQTSIMAPVNATSIGAYTQMKKSLGITSGNKDKGKPPKSRPVSGRRNVINMPPTTADDFIIGGGGVGGGDPNVNAYSCPRCDKMYLKSRDLEIHLSYCTA